MDAYIAQWIGARPKQEDAYAVRHFPEGTLAVVCDGMGGHDDGAAASRTAAETFVDTFVEETQLPLHIRLQEALEAANDAVGAYFEEHGGYGGTTLVAAFVGQGLLRWISVGDSSLQLIRRGRMVRLNADHSLRGMFRDCPGGGAPSGSAHMLRSAVTGEEISLIDSPPMPYPLLPGDCLLLASDGADDVLDHTDPKCFFVPDASPAAAVVELCRERNNPVADNVTVVSLQTDVIA